jgi:HEAT repeat protein
MGDSFTGPALVLVAEKGNGMARTTTHRKRTRSPKPFLGSMAIRIEPLLQDLRSHDGTIRLQARESFVTLGRAAVEPLIPLLQDHESQVRWEAAKALATIAAPQSAPALVDAMED